MGTANSFGQMLASSLFFSISLQRNLAGGNLVYYIFLRLTILGVRLSFFLVESLTREKCI